MTSTLVKRALDWAAVWHRDQRRKYPGVDVPYVSHAAGVGTILSRHGFGEAVVAAGVLHDVIEDCGITHGELSEKFSSEVADLVRHVSEEDKSLSWEERKSAYLEHFSHKPWEAQAITLSDKIDNFQSIIVAKAYGDPWAMFKRGRAAQIERFTELSKRAKTLAPHPLIDEYVSTLESLVAL